MPAADPRSLTVPPAWPRSRGRASAPALWSLWMSSLKVSCPRSPRPIRRQALRPVGHSVFSSAPARQVPLPSKPVAGDPVPLKSPTMLRVKIKNSLLSCLPKKPIKKNKKKMVPIQEETKFACLLNMMCFFVGFFDDGVAGDDDDNERRTR